MDECVCDYVWLYVYRFSPASFGPLELVYGKKSCFLCQSGVEKKRKKNQGRLEEIGSSINNNYIGGFMPTIKSMYLGCWQAQKKGLNQCCC